MEWWSHEVIVSAYVRSDEEAKGKETPLTTQIADVVSDDAESSDDLTSGDDTDGSGASEVRKATGMRELPDAEFLTTKEAIDILREPLADNATEAFNIY